MALGKAFFVVPSRFVHASPPSLRGEGWLLSLGPKLASPSCLTFLPHHCTQLMPDSRLQMEESPW